MKEESHYQENEQSYFSSRRPESHQKYGDSTKEFVITNSQVVLPVVNCSESVRGLYSQFLAALGQQLDPYLTITETESIRQRKDLWIDAITLLLFTKTCKTSFINYKPKQTSRFILGA